MAEHTNQAGSPSSSDVDRRRFLQAGLTGTGAIVAASLMHSSAAAAATPLAMTTPALIKFLVSRSEGPANRSRSSDRRVSHLGNSSLLDDAVRIVQEAVGRRRDFLRQRVGVQRPPQRGMDGARVAGPARQSVPDDQGLTTGGTRRSHASNSRNR